MWMIWTPFRFLHRLVRGHLLEDDGLNKTIAAKMIGMLSPVDSLGQEADDKTVGVDQSALLWRYWCHSSEWVWQFSASNLALVGFPLTNALG